MNTTLGPDPRITLSQALDGIWIKFLPEMYERVGILEAAAEAFAANRMTIEQHQAASRAAHKLAGVLGTFSLTRGTVLARELEIMYSREDGPDPEMAHRLGEIAAELRTIVANRK
jgi:HPt (histidine-containing phosphotransfer) domain-containing protein